MSRHQTLKGVTVVTLMCCCTLAVALEPTFKVDIETPSRPVLNGQTNLPNGTELMITISRKESNFSAQDKVKVAGGKFRSQRFSQKGTDLNPGKYKVDLVMPFAAGQSQSVRSILGDHGEKLTGPLVKHEKLGNYLRYVSTFQVGASSDSKADKAAREQERKDKEKWIRDSCKWIFDSSEKLRREGKLTGKDLTPEERQAKFDNCVKELSAKKK